MENVEEREDDGTLAFLNLPPNENNRSFNCDEIRQGKLVGRTFWVIDIIEDVQTKFTKEKSLPGRMLVKIKFNKDDPEGEARKFFTGTQSIIDTLRQVKQLKKFPRKVNFHGSGTVFWID